MRLQTVGALWSSDNGLPRTFCIMGLRVTLRGEVKPRGVAVAKASLNRAIESRDVDPKPSDLPMVRLKLG